MLNKKGNLNLTLMLLVALLTTISFLFSAIVFDKTMLKKNYQYLQYIQDTISTRSLLIDTIVEQLIDKEFTLEQDCEDIEGSIICSDYYLPSNTAVNINKDNIINLIENNAEFKTNLDINNIDVLQLSIAPTYLNEEDVYSFPIIKELYVISNIRIEKGIHNQISQVTFWLKLQLTEDANCIRVSNIEINEETIE